MLFGALAGPSAMAATIPLLWGDNAQQRGDQVHDDQHMDL
jgi:hypothetical protein